MPLDFIFNAKFFMKMYGNYDIQEIDNMYPFEFEIHYYMTVGHQKKIREARANGNT